MIIPEKYKKILEKYRKSKSRLIDEDILRKKEWKPKLFVQYENLCKLANRIVKFGRLREDIEKKYIEKIEFLNLDVKPEEVHALPIFLFIMTVAIFSILFLVTFNLFVLIIGIFAGVFLYYAGSRSLDYLYSYKLKQASNEIVLAVLYLAIYMRYVPNLENAVKFAAMSLTGFLGADFAKLLWKLSIKQYDNILEALNDYLKIWKDYRPYFCEAIYLIESSLYQPSEQMRLEMLDKAINRILDGVYSDMVKYANSLKLPVSALYMLGITLPLLTLILVPIAISFLGREVNPMYFVLFYDIILPIALYASTVTVFSRRPSGFPKPDVFQNPDMPPKGYFKLGNKTYRALPVAIIIAFIVALPSTWYIALRPRAPPVLQDVLYTLPAVFGIGLGISIYGHLVSKDGLKLQKLIKEIEKEYGVSLFQLGTILDEGEPAEIAFKKVAKVVEGTSVELLYKRILHNMTKLGMGLKRAIFDPKYGAVIYYPSQLLRSIFKLIVSAIEKNVKAAARALFSVSEYLRRVNEVEMKLLDLLSEELSSLRFQGAFVAPLMIAVVTALDALMVIILSSIGEKAALLEKIGGGATSSLMAVPMLLSSFGVTGQIPLTIFHIIIGVFLIEVVCIIAIIITNIENGGYIELWYNISRILLFAVIAYSGIVMTLIFIFGGLVTTLVAIAG